MLSIVTFLIIMYILCRKKNSRKNMFILTLIVSLFFFSSIDPIVGIPLYIYPMIVSIILGLLKENIKINVLLISAITLLILFMTLQISNIYLGLNISKSLLINSSITDVIDIENQLFYPTLNFNVFKHYLFFLAYLSFLIFNVDLIRSKAVIKELIEKVFKVFKILFILLIVEFLVVNILKGYNDRWLMQLIFSVNANQKDNWHTFGFYSVALWFTERSEMVIVLVYYLLRISSFKNIRHFLIWDFLSFIAVFCTGSSSALMAALFYGGYLGLTTIYKKNSILLKGVLLLSLVGLTIVIIYKYDILFLKINEFINPTINYGSAFYRRQSINYAIISWLNSPFIGQGIGTVYCHSSLLQILGNIGILGLFLTLIIHNITLGKRRISFIKVIFVLIISIAAFMIQQFTSPMFLAIYISLYYNFDFISN